ncbi:DNA-protecting protein DprA [Anabaena sp. FACHB-1237]|uniref:DNA-processing protein DprA n=1 Tax=Anabaena sp. FACHB-1237 TaxID=2692769 RepID=UPI0016804644|nr:DNA-processing protein DprA [Anabaena sp. FACHB-1237]MBD2138644.1 DNA-protecting protein DprA [Anabaena sp. FACHB-1237]
MTNTGIEERAYWLAWSQISGIGPILLQRLKSHFTSLEVAWNASKGELIKVEGLGSQTLQKVVEQRSQIHPQELLIKHQEINPNFWTPADPEYPQVLKEIPTPPSILYYRGVIDIQENLGKKLLVGIVGTRQPTEYGIKWTQQISTALTKHGFTIVSGMAEGIDTASHTAALKAGGRTIAVVGTGVDVIYPYKNRELYKEILASGLVISEYPAKTTPNRNNFPRRNRIIAGLSRAILVMEAPLKSGALITATYANEFGRDVYALPGRVDDQPSQGCLKLISQGAGLISQQLHELLTVLGAIPQIDMDTTITQTIDDKIFNKIDPQISKISNLSPELQQVINTLTLDILPFDLIVQKTNMDAGFVSSCLLELELMGLVSQLPGMRYQLIQH